MISRRNLLKGLLAAPAVVRASSLMPLWVPPALVLIGDGIADDSAALQAFFTGKPVRYRYTTLRSSDGRIAMPQGVFALGTPLIISPDIREFNGNCSPLLPAAGQPALIVNGNALRSFGNVHVINSGGPAMRFEGQA